MKTIFALAFAAVLTVTPALAADTYFVGLYSPVKDSVENPFSWVKANRYRLARMSRKEAYEKAAGLNARHNTGERPVVARVYRQIK